MNDLKKEVPKRTPLLYYGWVIVGLSFLAMAFHFTARFSFAIFQVPLIAKYGWSRGALGTAFALMMGIYAVSNPLAGLLVDRHGPKAVIPWGSVLVGAGLLGGYWISALWHVYVLLGVFIGMGTALCGFAMHSAMIPRWFDKKRGTATGIVFSGIGIGTLVLSPAIERLIFYLGWRETYMVYGIVVLIGLAPLLFFFLRDNPKEVGQNIDGSPGARNPAVPVAVSPSRTNIWQVVSLLKEDRSFLALACIGFITGLQITTVLTHLQLYLVDARFSTATGALVLGIAGTFQMLGSVGIGWVSDWIGRQNAQVFSCTLCGVSLILLLSIPWLEVGLAPAYGFGVAYGFAIGGMTACQSAMSADRFGNTSFGSVMGILTICYSMGGAIGPPAAGYLFDFTGSYLIAFSSLVAMSLLAIYSTLWIYRPKGADEPRAGHGSPNDKRVPSP